MAAPKADPKTSADLIVSFICKLLSWFLHKTHLWGEPSQLQKMTPSAFDVFIRDVPDGFPPTEFVPPECESTPKAGVCQYLLLPNRVGSSPRQSELLVQLSVGQEPASLVILAPWNSSFRRLSNFRLKAQFPPSPIGFSSFVRLQCAQNGSRAAIIHSPASGA